MVLFLCVLLNSLLSATIALQSSRLKDDHCASYDTCAAADNFFRTCSCDEDCYQFGTCCADAKVGKSRHELLYRCREDNVVTPVFAKTSCDPNFSGSDDVISACQNGGKDESDLLGNLLVSSNETLNTYWNWNCAICNHEEPSSILHWTVQVSCPDEKGAIDDKIIRRNLIFAGHSWGMDIKGEFIPCSVSYMQPDTLVNRLKYCAPNMVSDCPFGYEDREVIKKCHLYHGERKLRDKNIFFKNVHCAQCNGILNKNLGCFGRYYRPVVSDTGVSVIKVFFRSGTWVGDLGKQFKCPPGEAHDPFEHKCRTFVMPVYNSSCGILTVSMMCLMSVLAGVWLRDVYSSM